jgi:hypothetical protein
MTAREEFRKRLVALLRMRRDERYRRGVIQMAVFADVIDNREWEYLERQIGERVGEPRLP